MEPRPDVIVDFVFEDGMLFVAVQNIGSQPAQQVHISLERRDDPLGVPETPSSGVRKDLSVDRLICTCERGYASQGTRQR